MMKEKHDDDVIGIFNYLYKLGRGETK